MAKRNYVKEILSIRLRNELDPRYGGALIQFQALGVALDEAADLPETVLRYFPIAVVASLEAYFRSAVRELIDLGPPYSERAASFDRGKDFRIDFNALLAVQGKAITIGDWVTHLLPFNSLEDIDHSMSTVIGESFAERLKTTQDRWAVEIEGATPKPIIDDPAEVFGQVKETFRLRHIYCHEIAYRETASIEVIAKSFTNSSIFLKAADQLIWNVVAPNAPLTQSAMNEDAFRKFRDADKQLQVLCATLAHLLGDEERSEFAKAQEAWEHFRDFESDAKANRRGRGGTIWPTLKASEAETLTRLRNEELKRECEKLKRRRAAGADI